MSNKNCMCRHNKYSIHKLFVCITNQDSDHIQMPHCTPVLWHGSTLETQVGPVIVASLVVKGQPWYLSCQILHVWCTNPHSKYARSCYTNTGKMNNNILAYSFDSLLQGNNEKAMHNTSYIYSSVVGVACPRPRTVATYATMVDATTSSEPMYLYCVQNVFVIVYLSLRCFCLSSLGLIGWMMTEAYLVRSLWCAHCKC